MSFLLFKNININYKKQGKGKTNVVLLHGFLEGLDIWKDYSKELAKTYTVISIDLLGHGKSQCLAYVHTMEEMAEAVDAVLKELDIRKAVFVGHSLGGYVSLAFAELYIHKVKGLCMFNSTAAADAEQKKADRLRSIEIVKSNHELFIKMSVPNLFFNQKKYIKEIEKTLKIAIKTPKQGIIAAINGMMQRPSREIILKFSQFPVFYVIGKNDNVVHYEVAIKQCELAKEHSYYLSEKGSHMCFFEDEEALEQLKKFIATC
jgi:pimeloyl-ACP methyl ester carboxylesterase